MDWGRLLHGQYGWRARAVDVLAWGNKTLDAATDRYEQLDKRLDRFRSEPVTRTRTMVGDVEPLPRVCQDWWTTLGGRA